MTFQTIPQCTSPNMRPPPLPLTFSEETVAKNMKGGPPLFGYSYSILHCLHSEVKSEEKRKNGNEGMEERQSRPQGFSLKKWAPPIFLGKSPGDEVGRKKIALSRPALCAPGTN